MDFLRETNRGLLAIDDANADAHQKLKPCLQPKPCSSFGVFVRDLKSLDDE